jgi:hypothetical protein
VQNSIRSLAVTIALLASAESTVSASMVDPMAPVAGISQLELSQQWWQWVLSIPAATNPLIDNTGAFARTNNNGPIFFVAGTLGGFLGRTFDVPVGKPIFFPVLNAIDVEFEVSPPDTNCFVTADPLACGLAFISPGLNAATDLHATLDGQDLLTFPNSRQTSKSFFDLNLPPDDLFGVSAGFYPSIAVSDGYWVALEGLTPGQHTLFFGGTNPDLEIPVSGAFMTITVVPEPETYALMLAGLGLVGFAARRRKRLLPESTILDKSASTSLSLS